ncbi:MAG: hypothetical protein ACRC5M_05765 [Anaeroplasmataceae bacterium]
MIFSSINDYELIYLINDMNEKALELMYKKYSYLINKKVYEMGLNLNYKDDFMQIGYISLNTALNTFNEKYNKSFFKYYELILRRDLIRHNIKFSKYDLSVEDDVIDYIACEDKVEFNEKFDIDTSIFNKIELLVFNDIYVYNLSYDEIVLKHKITKKYLYNRIEAIKLKLRRKYNFNT